MINNQRLCAALQSIPGWWRSFSLGDRWVDAYHESAARYYFDREASDIDNAAFIVLVRSLMPKGSFTVWDRWENEGKGAYVTYIRDEEGSPVFPLSLCPQVGETYSESLLLGFIAWRDVAKGSTDAG